MVVVVVVVVVVVIIIINLQANRNVQHVKRMDKGGVAGGGLGSEALPEKQKL